MGLKFAGVVGCVHNVIIISYVNKHDDRKFQKIQTAEKDRRKRYFYKVNVDEEKMLVLEQTIAAQGVKETSKNFVEKMTNFFCYTPKSFGQNVKMYFVCVTNGKRCLKKLVNVLKYIKR